MAGVAGLLLGHQFLVAPTQGAGHMLKAYIAVALGGWGSVPGALLGALGIGLFETFVAGALRRCLGVGRTLYLRARGAGVQAAGPVRRARRPAGLKMRLAPFWLVLLVLPPLVALWVLPPFGQRMVTLAGIYGLMGLGYQLVFGQLGALNLAQGALFGLGAYAAALTAPIARAVRAARGDPRRGDPGGAGGGAAAAPAVALLRARHPGARLAGQPFGGACREL